MSKLLIQSLELLDADRSLADDLAAVGAIALHTHLGVVVLVAASPASIRGGPATTVLGPGVQLGVDGGGVERLGRPIVPGGHVELGLEFLLTRLRVDDRPAVGIDARAPRHVLPERR